MNCTESNTEETQSSEWGKSVDEDRTGKLYPAEPLENL